MNKRKTLTLCVLLAVICAAAIIITCILVFGGGASDSHIKIEDGNVQIVRGELDISLVREKLETRTLDHRGAIVEDTDKASKDFSASRDNIFGIDKDMLIGPTCSFTAHMAIKNLKPYPFEYWLEIVPVNGESLLAEQLELTVTVGEEVFIKRTLQSGLETKLLPSVQSGETANFTVKLEYLDVKNNDETKNTTLSFDMVVHARLIA